MHQFSLDVMTPVTVGSVNIRSELHGDDHVPAADIALKLTAPNTILDRLDGALCGMLYRAAEEAGKQPDLDGVEPVSGLPLLRCAKLQPIRLKHEFAGYRLTIDRGLGGPSNIVVADCGVDRFKADCHEGGTVELTFRAQASGLDEATLGKLATLIGSEVEITLEAPEPQPGAIDASRDGDFPFGGETQGDESETDRPETASEAPESASEPPKTVSVLPMGTPRTKRGKDATAAWLAKHAPKGDDGQHADA